MWVFDLHHIVYHENSLKLLIWLQVCVEERIVMIELQAIEIVWTAVSSYYIEATPSLTLSMDLFGCCL